MWMLFHRKAGTSIVRGGKTFVEECPTCERETRFREVEVAESFGVWFVDVVGDKERKFRCDDCEDVFDLRDQPAPAALPEPAVSARQKLDQLAAEQRRRDEARAKIETRIDDELAELKRRMGKL
jgi:hypothetical protein